MMIEWFLFLPVQRSRTPHVLPPRRRGFLPRQRHTYLRCDHRGNWVYDAFPSRKSQDCITLYLGICYGPTPRHMFYTGHIPTLSIFCIIIISYQCIQLFPRRIIYYYYYYTQHNIIIIIFYYARAYGVLHFTAATI